MKKRDSLIIVLFITLLCNFVVVNADIESNYFSTKLKEGKVLEWEESFHFISLERENETYLVEIEVIQDIPDFAIDHDFLYRYFNLSRNGTVEEERYIITNSIPRFILPIKYVEGLSVFSLYEHYVNASEEYQNYTVEQKKGFVEVNGTLGYNSNFIQFELIVHEETGIVKYRKSTYMLNELNYIVEISYLGGINLTNYHFVLIPFVLIGITIISKIARKKRKINLP